MHLHPEFSCSPCVSKNDPQLKSADTALGKYARSSKQLESQRLALKILNSLRNRLQASNVSPILPSLASTVHRCSLRAEGHPDDALAQNLNCLKAFQRLVKLKHVQRWLIFMIVYRRKSLLPDLSLSALIRQYTVLWPVSLSHQNHQPIMPRILLFGATGYLGSAIARSLVGSGNHTVYGISRSAGKASGLAAQEIVPVVCPDPVEDPEPYLDAIRKYKIDVVVDATAAYGDSRKLLVGRV